MSFGFYTENRKQEIIAELITTTINGNNILKDETYSKMIKRFGWKDIYPFANANEIPAKVFVGLYKKVDVIKAFADYYTKGE